MLVGSQARLLRDSALTAWLPCWPCLGARTARMDQSSGDELGDARSPLRPVDWEGAEYSRQPYNSCMQEPYIVGEASPSETIIVTPRGPTTTPDRAAGTTPDPSVGTPRDSSAPTVPPSNGATRDLDKVKVTVNLLGSELATLRDIGAKRGITVTDALRRAIALEKYVEDALGQGGKVLIEARNGSMRELLLR